jgi:predicted dehydrogenase
MSRHHRSSLAIAVIGVSLRGQILAREAISAHPGVRIAGAADVHAGRLRQFTREFSCFGSTDYREILIRPEIDAVIIASPDYLHEEHSLAALRAGKAVYLEKPMAISVEGCDRILRCSMETGVPLFMGHNMRHFTVIRTMKEMIDSGLIGDVKAAWCRHFISYGGDAYFKDWHAERRLCNGLLLQKAAHDIDILHWLCGGYTQRVTAMGRLAVYGSISERRAMHESISEPTGSEPFNERNWPPETQTELNPIIDVEDISGVLLEMDNGVQATYQQCHFTPDSWRNYTVIGSKGRVENFGDIPGNAVVRAWTTRSDRYRSVGDVEVTPPPEEGTHGGADPKILKEFVRNLLFAAPMSISPLEARQAVATGVAATESLRNGSEPRMVIPLEPDLWAHFHQEFQTRGTEVTANAS